MPARRQNDPTSDKALQGYVEEVCSLTSVAALKNATAAARLEIVLRLEEVEKCVDTLGVSPAKEHDREMLVSEIRVLRNHLSTPHAMLLDDMIQDDDESPLLTLPKKAAGEDHPTSATKRLRRANRCHVLGFADGEVRQYIQGCRGKSSRVHVRSQNAKSTAEAVLQQQHLASNAARPVSSFQDMLAAAQKAQFGTHQLLHQPPDLLDMVVLSGGAVPPKKQVEHQPPADIVNIGSRPLLRKGMRQDQIILSSSLDIDEDQLKKDIQRELPNVCDVEIQYQEDVSTPGAVSAVLVFSYSDPVCMKAKPDPLEERIEVLPDTQELPSINAGKEGRASKPNSDDGHENGPMFSKLTNGTFAKLAPYDNAAVPAQEVKKPSEVRVKPAVKAQTKQSLIMGCTKVELMAYVVITFVFVVPMMLFCCWIIKLFF